MKKAERQRLEAFIRSALPVLEMRDWRVVVSDQEPPADALAMTHRIPGQKAGVLLFSREFWTLDVYDKRQTVLHELLHLLSADVRDFVYTSFPAVSKPAAWDAFRPPFDQALEVMVDTAAHSFASLLDLEV